MDELWWAGIEDADIGFGVTNIFINEYLSKRSNDFAGTYSCDNIPPHLQAVKRFTIICNLSKVGQLGSHFVLITSRGMDILYFDPFGRPCSNHDINRFMTGCRRKIVYNDRQIQSPISTKCGLFCILYAIIFDSSQDKNTRIIKWSHNLFANDKICIRLLKQFERK